MRTCLGPTRDPPHLNWRSGDPLTLYPILTSQGYWPSSACFPFTILLCVRRVSLTRAVNTHINKTPPADVKAGQPGEARVCPVPRHWRPSGGGGGGGGGRGQLLLLRGGGGGGEGLVRAADLGNVEAEVGVHPAEVDLLHDEGDGLGERLDEVVDHESEGRTLVVGHTGGRTAVLERAGAGAGDGVNREVCVLLAGTAGEDLTVLVATEKCFLDQESHVLS